MQSLTHAIPEAALLAPPFNKIYKNSLIKENYISFDTHLSYAEDFLFNICYLKYVNIVAFIPDHLYYYDHTTENSLSKRVIPYFFDVSTYLNNTFARLFPNKYTERLYDDNMRRIQHNTLALYARCNGLKGYMQQIRKIFTNAEIKQASSSISCKEVRLRETFPAFTVRHNLFIIYILWCYTINVIPFVKYYVKHFLKRLR